MAPSWPAPGNNGACSVRLPVPHTETTGRRRVQKGQGVAGRDLPSSPHPVAPRGKGPAGGDLPMDLFPPNPRGWGQPSSHNEELGLFSPPCLPPQ